MPEAARVIRKLMELYPLIQEEEIGVRALPRDEEWLIFLNKEGHEEMFVLPGNFVDTCLEEGFCSLFMEECTTALGRLMESVRSPMPSAAAVIEKMKHLYPGLRDADITIAVSQTEPLWSFFFTRRGTRRPVEFKLPSEVISRCMEEDDCAELKKACQVAYRCLLGV